jgi:hypothetical protein
VIVTSNRGPDEWLATFADLVRAQAAIDRFTSNAYDLVIEGESYRKRLKPKSPAAKAGSKKIGERQLIHHPNHGRQHCPRSGQNASASEYRTTRLTSTDPAGTLLVFARPPHFALVNPQTRSLPHQGLDRRREDRH